MDGGQKETGENKEAQIKAIRDKYEPLIRDACGIVD